MFASAEPDIQMEGDIDDIIPHEFLWKSVNSILPSELPLDQLDFLENDYFMPNLLNEHGLLAEQFLKSPVPHELGSLFDGNSVHLDSDSEDNDCYLYEAASRPMSPEVQLREFHPDPFLNENGMQTDSESEENPHYQHVPSRRTSPRLEQQLEGISLDKCLREDTKGGDKTDVFSNPLNYLMQSLKSPPQQQSNTSSDEISEENHSKDSSLSHLGNELASSRDPVDDFDKIYVPCWVTALNGLVDVIKYVNDDFSNSRLKDDDPASPEGCERPKSRDSSYSSMGPSPSVSPDSSPAVSQRPSPATSPSPAAVAEVLDSGCETTSDVFQLSITGIPPKLSVFYDHNYTKPFDEESVESPAAPKSCCSSTVSTPVNPRRSSSTCTSRQRGASLTIRLNRSGSNQSENVPPRIPSRVYKTREAPSFSRGRRGQRREASPVPEVSKRGRRPGSMCNMTPAERLNHNSMERHRRREQRLALEGLRKLVPEVKDDEKAPKVRILDAGSTYITQLAKDVEESSRRITKLRKDYDLMKKYIEHLKRKC